MTHGLEVRMLGELQVLVEGQEVALPPSRKARALLAFLIATRRPHRRERLCELFWDLPDDPKATLRWALSKLRRVVDGPEQSRIVADRERVWFDAGGACIDIHDIAAALQRSDTPVAALEDMAQRLQMDLLDGLDDAGDERFRSWLTAEREDARVTLCAVLRQLVDHPDITPRAAEKWERLWQEVDPDGAHAHVRPEPTSKPAGDIPQARKTAALNRALKSQNIGFCEVPDGTKVAYATIGSGRPILKAANWLNHLEFDWSSPIWGRSFAALARYRTFIRYDERGCGLSDWDVKDLSFDAFVEDLEAVADRVGLERFPLLGISQGCAVSIEYAARHPERVSGLILVSGYAAGWRVMATTEEQARREAVLTLTELGWGTDNPAYRHIFSQTFMPKARAADLAWFDEFQRQTTSPRNAARFQEAFGHIDVRDRLADVRAPTLVLHCKDDQRIPLADGKAVADGIPGAEFVVLDSCNHIIMDSEPAWRTCAEAIQRFVVQHGL
ncbi:alpha/beta hydrolase [Pontivivens ytuae]|uniref:Alpha/beta fold hydrolase n=1 Tax=Pontivivens ytuae TaxID=2789856 RepID=A0A7S9LRQ6_9RHOB|nr:alpha/beta hydrolase [Pontivivens ytuae]QPH54074.1 alpha/beta fold hydrolase [Pontivivens ytuae]